MAGERAPTPTVHQLRQQVVEAVLNDDLTALATYSRFVLKAHRARSRQLWKRLQLLAEADDLGAGARGSPASALAALAGAHARLVDADRTILGMRDGQVQPAAAGDEPLPVLGLVARASPAGFAELVRQHKAGQLVTAAEPGPLDD